MSYYLYDQRMKGLPADAERRRSKLEPLMMWNMTERRFSNSDCSVDLFSNVLMMVSRVESALIVRFTSLGSNKSAGWKQEKKKQEEE